MDGLGRIHNHSTHPDRALQEVPFLPDLSPFSPQPLSLGTASWRCRWRTPRAQCGCTCSSSPARAMGCSSWLLASPITSCSSCKPAACRSASQSSPQAGLCAMASSRERMKGELSCQGMPRVRQEGGHQSCKIWLNAEKQAPPGEAAHPG